MVVVVSVTVVVSSAKNEAPFLNNPFWRSGVGGPLFFVASSMTIELWNI